MALTAKGQTKRNRYEAANKRQNETKLKAASSATAPEYSYVRTSSVLGDASEKKRETLTRRQTTVGCDASMCTFVSCAARCGPSIDLLSGPAHSTLDPEDAFRSTFLKKKILAHFR